MKNKIFILFTVLLLCATSCLQEVKIDSLEKEIFINNDRIGIYNGDNSFTFNPLLHQESYNVKRKQFRLQTDEQDSCLNVILAKYPKNTGNSVPVNIDYRDPRTIINNTADYECSKISHNKIWLWNKKGRIGIIIPQYGI